MFRKRLKGSSKTRRCKKEIDQGHTFLQCPYCTNKLTRQQTLRDHVRKFHPHCDPKTTTPQFLMNKKNDFQPTYRIIDLPNAIATELEVILFCLFN